MHFSTNGEAVSPAVSMTLAIQYLVRCPVILHLKQALDLALMSFLVLFQLYLIL